MSAKPACPHAVARPAKPAPMPPRPSLWLRLSRGLKSSLALVQEGAFLTGGAGRHVIRQAPFFTPSYAYTLREPELVREALAGRAADFPKSRLMRAMLEDLIGDSIFVANGEAWRWRRAIVDQALAQARVREVMGLMREAAEALIGRLAILTDEGPVLARVDLEATHFAADVIFRTLFSEPIEADEAHDVIAAFEVYQALAYAHSMLGLARIPKGLLPGAGRRRRAASTIREALAKRVRRRLADQAAGLETPDADLLATLISASDPETGRRFGETELIDEAAMLFLAGHETSASALGWALYLLALSPQTQARVRAEVDAAVGDGDLEFAHMKTLVLTRNVFREALRLYPPVAQIARDSIQPEAFAEHEAAAGSVVFCPAFVLHRQPRFWRDPDGFDPDRFATDEDRTALRDAYFPFSMGPRICPGAAFALQEATLALALLVRAFDFAPAPGCEPQPVGRLTLRSQNGVTLRVQRVSG